MVLYHATTRQSLGSIQTEGLRVSYAAEQARIKGIWLHTSSKSAWAILHTQRRHGAALQDVVVLEVTMPRSWLRRFQGGLWYTTKDIGRERLGTVHDAAEFAASAK